MATKPNVAELVERMPDTDKEIQAKAEAAKQRAEPGAPDAPDAPGKPKPKPDRYGDASKFTGPDPVEAEKVFTAILSGGRESILELLGLVREPGDAGYTNHKAGYVLHGLVISAGRTGGEGRRRLLAEAIASQLGNKDHSVAVKGFLIRELRLLGGGEVVDALGRQLTNDDLCEDATQALLSIREGVVSQFRGALAKARGRSRVTILQALGILRDAASVDALKAALAEADRDVRRTATWALANIGDAGSATALLDAADRAEGWERSQATGHCLLLAERLVASGKKTEAARVYRHLRDTRADRAERHVRASAEAALGAIMAENRTQ